MKLLNPKWPFEGIASIFSKKFYIKMCVHLVHLGLAEDNIILVPNRRH